MTVARQAHRKTCNDISANIMTTVAFKMENTCFRAGVARSKLLQNPLRFRIQHPQMRDVIWPYVCSVET